MRGVHGGATVPDRRTQRQSAGQAPSQSKVRGAESKPNLKNGSRWVSKLGAQKGISWESILIDTVPVLHVFFYPESPPGGSSKCYSMASRLQLHAPAAVFVIAPLSTSFNLIQQILHHTF